MINTVLLLNNGEVVEVAVPSNTNVDNFKKTSYFQHKGSGSLSQLHYWELFDQTIILYGWTDGEAGDENKHELPAPIDSSLYFGDILVFRLNENGKLSQFSKEYFDKFIEHMMGGFDDLEETSEEASNVDDSEDADGDADGDADYQPSESDSEDSEEDSDNSDDGDNSQETDDDDQELEFDHDLSIWDNRKEAMTSEEDDDESDNNN